MSKKLITRYLMVIVVLGILLWNILPQLSFYIRSYNAAYVAEIYSNSQYIKGQDAKRGIGDDGLYAFAANYYISGGDPSSVNFEHPTLGKYLTGISIILFHNENLIYLLYALLVLFVTYKLAFMLTKNQLQSFFAIFILVLSPFFTIQYVPTSSEQLSVALLDLPFTLFFLCALYFFVKAQSNQKLYFISSLFWGITFSTKFFPSLLLILPILAVSIMRKRKQFMIWLWSLVIIPVVYVLSYSMYFWYHPSLIEFLRFQKWMIAWRMGNPYVFGNIFRTILFGRYQNWWDGGWITDNEWSIWFATIVILGIIGSIIAIWQKDKNWRFFSAICIVYMLYVAVNTVGIARYILPIFPLFVIFAVSLTFDFFAIIRQWYFKVILKR